LLCVFATMMTESLGILTTPSPVKKRHTPQPRTVSLPITTHKNDAEDAPTKDPPLFHTTGKMRNRSNDEDDADGDDIWMSPSASLPSKKSNKMTGQRCLFGLTVAAFLLAALLGLSTNLHAVWTETSSLQKYVLPTAMMTAFESANPVHNRVLYRSYHERPSSTSTISISAAAPRPKLYIHIGPHKTASTTLQTDLTYYQDRLAQDNIIYLGRYYHPYIGPEGRLVLNRADDSAIQTATRDIFRGCWHDKIRDCVEDLNKLLLNKFDRRPYHALPNLLMSDEAFLKMFDDWVPAANAGGENGTTAVTATMKEHINQHYVLLQEVLGREWDVTIVLAYRRFYEWLPSNKHQTDKTRTFECHWNSKHLEPLFPLPLSPSQNGSSTAELETRTQEMFETWGHQHFFSEATVKTLKMLSASNSNFHFKVFHLYGKLSVRTNFLCNVLEGAEFSCRASRKQDAVAKETRINTRDTDEDTVFVQYPSAFFDAMAVSAAGARFVNRAVWERSAVAKALRAQYYKGTAAWWEDQQEQAKVDDLLTDDIDDDQQDDDDADSRASGIEKSQPNPTTPWEIPLICPTEDQFHQLLRFSLSLEFRYLPKLYRKSYREHRAAFYATSRLAYCWVDDAALLGEPSSAWKDYIVKTFSNPPPPSAAMTATE